MSRTVKVGYSDATTPSNWKEVSGANGKMLVVSGSFLHEVMAGNVAGHDYVQVRAHAHSVGTTDQELSALGAAGFGNWPSAAAGAVLVSSDNAEDVAGGDGALTVIVRGLDISGVEVTEIVTMSGTTPTGATTQEFWRINEIEVDTCGASLTNEGDITASISGTDIIKIYANHSTSDGGRFTIAAGKEGHFGNIEGSNVGNKEMSYHIFCRNTIVANKPFRLRSSWHSKDGGFRPNGALEIFTEMTDVIFVAHAELAGAKASGSFEGYTKTTT